MKYLMSTLVVTVIWSFERAGGGPGVALDGSPLRSWLHVVGAWGWRGEAAPLARKLDLSRELPFAVIRLARPMLGGGLLLCLLCRLDPASNSGR